MPCRGAKANSRNTCVAKCIDAYISLSAARNISGTSSTASQHHHLSGAFPNNTNGSATSSASLNTSTTPFSQHTQPSKSLLSRQYSSSLKPSPSTDGYSENISLGGRPVTLPKNVQKNLQVVIRRIIESCYEIGAYRQVVGIAVEARNLDMLREVMLNASLHSRSSEKKNASASAGGGEEIMEYVLDICMNLVQERALRDEVSF